VLGELFEELNLNDLLDAEPNSLRHPLLENSGERNILPLRAGDEELHLLVVVLNTFKDAKLHQSESKLSEEDLLVTHKETTLDPSVNSHTNVLSQVKHALLIIIVVLSELNSLKEEGLERFERVLVHVVNNAKLNEQEVKGGTLTSDTSVNFTEVVNSDFSLLGLNLLALNLGRGGFGHFKRLNERNVGEDGVGVSLRQVLEKVGLKLSESSDELILLVDKLFFGLLKIGFLDTHNHGK